MITFFCIRLFINEEALKDDGANESNDAKAERENKREAWIVELCVADDEQGVKSDLCQHCG